MCKVFKHFLLYMRLHGCVHIMFTKRNRNVIIFGTREVIDGQSLGITAYALWVYVTANYYNKHNIITRINSY